ncbi:MAG TPA: hypothetical protein EYG88_02935 [Desulfocapsa sulfexigens]|nr:hypothetical protein [Desulfocapsa sulfexigens]
MAITSYIKKRPCRICRKWFAPNPRVGNRQKTCGAKECRDKWHAKKCSQWNRQNRVYFQGINLSKKLQAVQNQETAIGKPPSQLPKSGISPKLPQEVIQEVIGVQLFVIVEYLSQVLLRSVQEVIRIQHTDILKEVRRLPQRGHSRGDSQKRAP